MTTGSGRADVTDNDAMAEATQLDQRWAVFDRWGPYGLLFLSTVIGWATADALGMRPAALLAEEGEGEALADEVASLRRLRSCVEDFSAALRDAHIGW